MRRVCAKAAERAREEDRAAAARCKARKVQYPLLLQALLACEELSLSNLIVKKWTNNALIEIVRLHRLAKEEIVFTDDHGRDFCLIPLNAPKQSHQVSHNEISDDDRPTKRSRINVCSEASRALAPRFFCRNGESNVQWQMNPKTVQEINSVY